MRVITNMTLLLRPTQTASTAQLTYLKDIEALDDSDADLLIGSRIMQRTKGMSALKTFGNWGLSFLTYFLFGIRVSDSQSGLRIFSGRAIEKLEWQLVVMNFARKCCGAQNSNTLIVEEYAYIRHLHRLFQGKRPKQLEWLQYCEIITTPTSHGVF